MCQRLKSLAAAAVLGVHSGLATSSYQPVVLQQLDQKLPTPFTKHMFPMPHPCCLAKLWHAA
jgi:hypothetical protein